MTSIPAHTAKFLLAALVVAAALPGIGAAQNITEEENSTSADDEPVVEIHLDKVVEALEDINDNIQNFTGSKTLEDIFRDILFGPFRELIQLMLEEVAVILTTTPDIHPNPAVENIHQLALKISYLVATLAFMVAGILHMVGPIFGISYSQVRKILPRVIIALVFSTVSLPLLQLGIDFSDALTHVFKPSLVSDSIGQMMGLRVGAVLVWIINASLLLGVLVIFLIRDIYIMFAAAISPLLAITWSLPRAKRYADSFISGWFAALLIGPLDMIVLRFSIKLMRGSGATALQSATNWLFGIAGLALLIIIPYQLWGVSQTAVGQAYSLSRGVKSKVKKHRKRSRRNKAKRHRREYWKRQERKWDQYREKRLKQLEDDDRSYRGDD